MNAMVMLLACLAAGVVLQRTGKLPDNAPAALNAYVINVALPALADAPACNYINGRSACNRCGSPLPTIDAAGAASLARWLMAAAVLAGLLWLVDAWITRHVRLTA